MVKIIYRYEQRSNQKSKAWPWKRFFKLFNNAVSVKTMGNVRKHRDMKLVTTETQKTYLVSQPLSCYKMFHKKCVDYRNEKISNMNIPVYLGLSILELSEILM